MVTLGPIDPDQQHGGSLLVSTPALGLEDDRQLNGAVLERRHAIPPAVCLLA
jgi:hypothetical protein